MVMREAFFAGNWCLIIQDKRFLQSLLQGKQEATAIQAYHGLKRSPLHIQVAEYHH
jgi:hypothetical protein